VVSDWGPVAGSCEHDVQPSVSGTTAFVGSQTILFRVAGNCSNSYE
jgi:hypothetical protein